MAKKDPTEPEGAGRWILFIVALVLGLPLLLLCGLTMIGPPSAETIVFTLAVFSFVIGGLAAPWTIKGSYGVRAGFFIAVAVIGFRIVTAGHGNTIRYSMGPNNAAGRTVDSIVPERDLALGSSGLLLALGAIPNAGPGLLDALRGGYDRMAIAEGSVPSPMVGTYLFGQVPEEHALLRIAPASRFDPPEAVVLFLHGGMGNATVMCWQVSVAAIPVGMDVVCPSTVATGAWAEPDGRRTVDLTIAQLRAQGVERVYLAGLSAGAVGASRIASEFEIEGLILISGASRQANPAAIPTLILQGAEDAMMPPEPARQYAERLGDSARYVEVEGAGHWLLLSHHDRVTRELRTWLAEREGMGEIHD